MATQNEHPEPQVTVKESILVLLVVLITLGGLIIFGGLSPQVPLLVADTFLMLYGWLRRFGWGAVMEGVESGVKSGAAAMVIFLMIGILIASWIFSGTIPTIMAFGFHLISAQFFLPTVFIVCSLIALACGSSLTTVSTIGIAFMGIGLALKSNPGLTAGAIVSGAFFGANTSPLSGTTNLAASIGDVDLYQHIRGLFFTDLPTWFLALCLYLFLGLRQPAHGVANLGQLLATLDAHFWLSAWTLLPVLLLLVMAWAKVPAIPSLALASAAGLLLGWLHAPTTTLKQLANLVMNGYVAKTGNQTVNLLLSKGGVTSMLSSLSLIIFALILGGLLIRFRIIGTLIDQVEEHVRTRGPLVLATVIAAIGVNVLVGEQYLSVILPGEAFKGAFDRLGVSRLSLTRVLNDAGAAVNAIVPWSVSGVFIAGALQVPALRFIPYAFFPLMLPLVTVLGGFSRHRGQAK